MSIPNPLRPDLRHADIHALAQHVQRHVGEHWQAILDENAKKLADAYARGGDMAYGTYLGLLFRPVNRQLKAVGFVLTPDLPGDLDRSREWGNAPDETNQQRRMWSLVQSADDEGLGALVTVIFHDHTGFRLPCSPHIIALTESSNDAVIGALSARSEEFRSAREFTIEVAEYLKSLESNKSA